MARHDLPQKWGGACHHSMSPGHRKRGSWPMHRELSTRCDRAPGAEPPRPERTVPKAQTQAWRVALRRWPRRKATPNRRPGTVGRLRAYLPRAPSTLGPRARRCPDSKKNRITVDGLGFSIKQYPRCGRVRPQVPIKLKKSGNSHFFLSHPTFLWN